MVVVDKDGAIFWNWIGELCPNSHFTLNNSTFKWYRGDYQIKCLLLMKLYVYHI